MVERPKDPTSRAAAPESAADLPAQADFLRRLAEPARGARARGGTAATTRSWTTITKVARLMGAGRT